MIIQRRLASVTAVIAASLIGLTGCGGDLGPDLHPGTAAVVGDSSISISDVDAKAEQLCRFGVETGQLQTAVPMASVRSSYLQAFVNKQIAQDYVEHNGVADDPALTRELAAAQQAVKEQVGSLDASLRPIYVEMSELSNYYEIVKTLAGEDFTTWVAEADVQRDPRFPALDDTGAVTRTGELSVPVSGLAKAPDGAKTQEEFDAYVATLPASQKCGTPPDA